jgi:membrane-associated protease RseP (regulator of RpoE activity)
MNEPSDLEPRPSSTPGVAPARPNYVLHLGLFLATCLTTTWVGIRTTHPEVGWSNVSSLWPLVGEGLPYSLSIMGILLTHEMGHYVFARWHGVKASLPYFLPIPLPLVGTMGAIIKMEGRIGNRNALADIGASGPLAGLLVAVPVLAYGIHLSPVNPVGPGLLEGNSILYLTLKYLIKGAILPGGGMDVNLHPMAWAGWVGLLVTMINLLPIGQLDGGHVAFAYFGDRYERAARTIHRLLPLLALLAMTITVLQLWGKEPSGYLLLFGFNAGLPWLVWTLMIQILKRVSGGRYHPPVGEQDLSPGRRKLCLAMMVIFVLILVPVPMRANF